MKKTLLILACFISSFSFAQLPANSLGADFTVTDIDGETHNLYDILDEGKTVILDLFATWCGPCWNYAATGVLEELQSEYPDAVFCMAIEADPSTAESTIFNSDLGNWTTVIDYMMADDPSGQIADDYALAYYPTIYKICPDRMVTEVGQLSSVSAFMNEVNSCSQATYSKDMRIVSYTGDGTHCGGTLQNASIQVQNYSLGASVNSFNVLTMVNGNTVDTTPWSGNLDTYETAMIDLGSISNIPDNASISFEVQYEGDMDSENNMMPAYVSGSTPASVSISLYIQTDNWAEETSWELLDENGNTVDSGSGYANNTAYEYDWNLSYGCYTFNIYDTYGDGVEASIWGAYDDGYVSLNDQSNGVMWYGIAYGYGESIAFEVMPGLDITEEKENTVSIYPNPSSNFTNLNLYLANNENITIKLYNSLGQVVKTDRKGLMPHGNHDLKINLDNLVEGLYFIELQIGNSIELHPINVVK
tara:strand:- start:282 stop:1706 length:1425 start_codon:yes stop_codon:yes gene_type:complete